MLLTIILIIALIGIIAGFVMSKKGDGRGSVIMTVAALLGMTVGLAHFFLRGATVDEHPVKVQEAWFASIAAERLGMSVAEQMPGAKVLIIMPFEFRTPEPRRKAMLAGIGRALKDKMVIAEVVNPPLPPAVRAAYESELNPDLEQQEVPDIAEWFTAAYFDMLLAKYPGDYTVVISLAGLPEDAQAMRCLKDPKGVKFATVFGSLYKLHPIMTAGRFIADVQHRRVPNPQAEPPDEDIVTSFERRFLLITPKNMAELKQKYPDLF